MDDAQTMSCVLCGERKAFPDGFPSRMYAECWKCCWDRHFSEKHPPKKVLRLRSPFYRKEVRRG